MPSTSEKDPSFLYEVGINIWTQFVLNYTMFSTLYFQEGGMI